MPFVVYGFHSDIVGLSHYRCPALWSYSSSFAVMVILAFRTFDTGQPDLAFSAAFWKAAWSAFGTRAGDIRCR